MRNINGRGRLLARLPAVGVWSLIQSLDVVAVICGSKPDFVVFDWEHGGWTPAGTDLAVVVAHGMGVGAVVRIANPHAATVQRAHDTGADAIQVAGISDGDGLDALLAASDAPPSGTRGFSPWSFDSMLASEERRSRAMLMPQVESMAALDAILSLSRSEVSRFDGVFVGRFDLSVSLGVPARLSAPGVIDTISRLVAHVSGTDVVVGTVAVDADDAHAMRELGAGYITVSSDRAILADGVRGLMRSR